MKHISELIQLALKNIEQNSNQKPIEMRNNLRISEIYIMLEIREPKTFRQLCTIFETELTEEHIQKMLHNLRVKELITKDVWYSLTDLGTQKLNQHIDKILSKL